MVFENPTRDDIRSLRFMESGPELNSWLRDVCREHFAALSIPCWWDGENLCFSYRGVEAALWLAAFLNPFAPDNDPPICCLGIPARLLTLYRAEITGDAEFIGGLLDELLDELKGWS